MLPQIRPAILTLGWILFAIAAGEGIMALVALATEDGHDAEFGVSALVTALVAGACVLTTRGRTFELKFRDATLLTVVAWVVVPAFAALEPDKRSAIVPLRPAHTGHDTDALDTLIGRD